MKLAFKFLNGNDVKPRIVCVHMLLLQSWSDWSGSLQTIACQALPMGFSRQEYWSGWPCPLLQGIFPTQGLNQCLLVSCIGRRVLYHKHHPGSPKPRIVYLVKWLIKYEGIFKLPKIKFTKYVSSFFKYIFILFIYLAVLALTCSTWA